MTDAAVARAKTRLTAGREEILARHRAGAGGQEVVRAISALTDELISELFQAIAAQVGGGDFPLSLVATGGYGRRELAPRSDVDLLALLPDAKDAGRARANEVAGSSTGVSGMPGWKRATPRARWTSASSSPARTTPSAPRSSTDGSSAVTRSCSRASSAPRSPSWSSAASRSSSATSWRSSTSAAVATADRSGCSSHT